jgi:glucosamine-6-phosphate deaminase
VKIDKLVVVVHGSRDEMGRAAAEGVARRVKEVVAAKGTASIVLASAPSQLEFLAHLRSERVEWGAVDVFHMDEYIGVGAEQAESFSHFLWQHFVKHVHPRAFHRIDGLAEPQQEAERYSQLISGTRLDVVCCGIGINGHIAFNDPGASFSDPLIVRVVALAEASRLQQVGDGMFPRLEEVPMRALTLTVPALLSAETVSCVVPGASKESAVRSMLTGPVGASCPASVLRRHRDATLHLDRDALGSLVLG